MAPTDGAGTAPQQARHMRIEREGSRSAPMSRRWPRVIGGVCEFCGILDSNVPSQFQYKLCGHFRGMDIMCSYCPESKNPEDVVYHANMNVAEHPDKPGTLIAWCDSFNCSEAHLKRFQRNAA